MAKELIFYRDKAEKFRCSLHIDGAQLHKSSIRLCLEMKDGTNYFFKGKIDLAGQCIIPIPALPNVTLDEGVAIVEVIAESSYFSVFESPFKIKNSITVRFEPEIVEEVEESVAPKITFSLVEENIDETIHYDTHPPEIVEEKIPELPRKGRNKGFDNKALKHKEEAEDFVDLPSDKDIKSILDEMDDFTTFDDFMKKITNE